MARVSAKSGEKAAKKSEELKSNDVILNSSGLTNLVNEDRISYTDVNAYAGTDLDIVASRIAVEVTFSLSEEISELNVYSSNFRMGLHRMARWILISLFENKEKCVVVPDAIPGYTAMGFKRESFNLTGKKTAEGAPSLEKNTVEKQAATMILEQFLEKQKSVVMVVECRDLLLMLFPVSDMRSNLRKLGYIFEN